MLPQRPGREATGSWRRLGIVSGVLLALVVLTDQCSRSNQGTSSPSDSTETASIGPTYSTTQYRAAAQELVRRQLRDPGSAEFTDIRVIEARGDRATVVCGYVNARNGFGGMTGPKRFVVGGAVAIEGDLDADDMTILWNRFC